MLTKTQTRERWEKTGYVRWDHFEQELNKVKGIAVSSKRILGNVGTEEGFKETQGESFFFNHEKKKLQLTRYMEKNDDDELVKIEGKDAQDIENKWEDLRKKSPWKAVYVSDYAIEKAAEGGPLRLGVLYVRGEWLSLFGVGGPYIDARVAYDKQEQTKTKEVSAEQLSALVREKKYELVNAIIDTETGEFVFSRINKRAS